MQLQKEIVGDLSRLVSPFRQPESTCPSEMSSAGRQNQVVHPLVACDVCDRPIIGVRYKCG